MKVIALFLACSVVSVLEAVKVTVFYESLCPWSIDFIQSQLSPTWDQLSQYMEIEFVPYGNADQVKNENGSWTFDCQHGPEECQGNMEQACALSILSNNVTAKVSFILCDMMDDYPPDAGEKCAENLGIDFNPIKNCANSNEGEELLAALGDRTHNFSPPVKSVPRIAFDDIYTKESQRAARTNLKKVVCQLIKGDKPKECDDEDSDSSDSTNV